MKKTNFLLFIFCFLLAPIHSQRNINADALLDAAYEYYAQDELSLSLSKIKEAINLDTTYAISKFALADYYYQTEQYTEAIKASKEVIRMSLASDTTKQEAYDMIGFSFMKQENFFAALQNYNLAIEQYDSVSFLYYSRALSLWNLSNNNLALNDLKQAIFLEQNMIEAHQAILELASEQEKSALIFLSSSFSLANFFFNVYYDKQFALLEKVQQDFVAKTEKNKIKIIFPPRDNDSVDTFKSIDFALALALVNNEKISSKKDNSATRFARVLFDVSSFIENSQMRNKGLLWKTYGQYFIDLKNSGHLETASYLINFQKNEKVVLKWITKNFNNVKSFEDWTLNYRWN